MRAQVGKEEAQRCFAIVGKGPEVKNILECVEIDHTRADVEVIDDVTGRKLGRPWRTLALCRASRAVLAARVHFDGPSTGEAMKAFREIMLPKEFLKDIVPELDYEYPCHGVPETLFFDRGTDFDNDYIRDVLNEFDIHAEYEPGRKPRYKGRVERFHRTLNEEVDHTLPGATPPRDKDGIQREPDGAAYITLSEYNARMWRWISMVYMKRFHRGLRDIPLKVWRERENLRLPRPLPSKESLKILLNRIEYLTPRNTGVQFKHLYWNGPALRQIRLHPTYKRGDKVRVRINEDNLAEAWVVNPVTREMERLNPVLQDYMNGLTLYQHRMALMYSDELLDGARDEAGLMEARRALREEAESLRKRGKAKAAVARDLDLQPALPSEEPAPKVEDGGAGTDHPSVVQEAPGENTGDDLLPTVELRKTRTKR